MQQNVIQELLDAVTNYIDDRKETVYTQRDLLTISTKCTSQKTVFIRKLKKSLKLRYKTKLDIFTEHLKYYNENNILIDNSLGLFKIVADVYEYKKSEYFDKIQEGAELYKVHQGANLCHFTILSTRIFKEIIENLTSEVKTLSQCLSPVNKLVYYSDQEIGYIEKIFRKVFFSILKKNMQKLKLFIAHSLLISKAILKKMDIGIDMFSLDIKYFLGILHGFGLSSKALKGSQKALAQIDIRELEEIQDNFILVFSYFKTQKYVYSKSFEDQIEQLVFHTLYEHSKLEFIAKSLLDLEQSMAIYTIFIKSSLKYRLIEAFDSLLPRYLHAFMFLEFTDKHAIIKRLMTTFNDKDFNDLYAKYLEGLLDSPINCSELAAFVESAFDGLQSLKLYSSFDLIVEIVKCSKAPELFLKELQERLTIRIMKARSVLVNNMSSNGNAEHFKTEMLFLAKFEKMYSENMCCMIRDLLNIKRDNQNSLFLMTMCKWPVFQTSNIFLPIDDLICKYKSKISNELKEERKKISWVDSLSTVIVEIFGKKVRLSLFQYSVVLKLADNLIINKDKMKPVLDFIESPEASCYKAQFNLLLEDLIVFSSGSYSLNQCFEKSDYTCFNLQFQSAEPLVVHDTSYNVQLYNEAKVTKIMKKVKQTAFSDLKKSITALNEEELRKTLQRLHEKEIVVFDGQSAVYCP
ncbi:hypothetical protein GINT2_001460 [Glugoides intestinalis]